MINHRGFVGGGALISILVGLAMLVSGAYYSVQQQAQKEVPVDDTVRVETATPRVETTELQSAQNTPVETATPTPMIATQSVPLAISGKYILTIPANWRTEKVDYKAGGGIDTKDILIYDEHNALVMKTTQPLREVGYENSINATQQSVITNIGTLDTVLRSNSTTNAGGSMHYMWMGGKNFWDDSFEIFVYFGNWQHFKTMEDQKANRALPLKYSSLSEIQNTGGSRSLIENVISGIQFTNSN